MRELWEVWASEEGARAQPPLPLGCLRPRARAAGRGGARERRGWRTLLCSIGGRGVSGVTGTRASSDPRSPAARFCGACRGSPRRDSCSMGRAAPTESAATGASSSPGQWSRVNTARPRCLGGFSAPPSHPEGDREARPALRERSIQLRSHQPPSPGAASITLRTRESLLSVNRVR